MKNGDDYSENLAVWWIVVFDNKLVYGSEDKSMALSRMRIIAKAANDSGYLQTLALTESASGYEYFLGASDTENPPMLYLTYITPDQDKLARELIALFKDNLL